MTKALVSTSVSTSLFPENECHLTDHHLVKNLKKNNKKKYYWGSFITATNQHERFRTA